MLYQQLPKCPFCGGKAEFEYEDWNAETEDGDDGTGVIVCTNCRIRTPRLDEESAIEFWSTRYTNNG